MYCEVFKKNTPASPSPFGYQTFHPSVDSQYPLSVKTQAVYPVYIVIYHAWWADATLNFQLSFLFVLQVFWLYKKTGAVSVCWRVEHADRSMTLCIMTKWAINIYHQYLFKVLNHVFDEDIDHMDTARQERVRWWNLVTRSLKCCHKSQMFKIEIFGLPNISRKTMSCCQVTHLSG